MTTNIVECEPDELTLGQTVEVTFEKLTDDAGAVWLPLFRPSAGTTAGPQATDEAVAALRAQMHLDSPLVVQYFEFARGVLRGELITQRNTDIISKRPEPECKMYLAPH